MKPTLTLMMLLFPSWHQMVQLFTFRDPDKFCAGDVIDVQGEWLRIRYITGPTTIVIEPWWCLHWRWALWLTILTVGVKLWLF
jgi:hypothetical protein